MSWLVELSPNVMQTFLRHWPLLLMENTFLWHPMTCCLSLLLNIQLCTLSFDSYDSNQFGHSCMDSLGLKIYDLSGSIGTKCLRVKLWPNSDSWLQQGRDWDARAGSNVDATHRHGDFKSRILSTCFVPNQLKVHKFHDSGWLTILLATPKVKSWDILPTSTG